MSIRLDAAKRFVTMEGEYAGVSRIPVFYTISPWRRFLQLLPSFIGLVLTLKIIGDIFELRRTFSSLKVKLDENSRNDLEKDISLNSLKVSIIIPTHNEAQTLPRLLASLKSQTYPNIEVVVVDFKSHDRTEEIANSFGSKFVSIDKPGIGLASNVGVQESDGDIIVRTDSDAWFPRNFIERLVRIFFSRPDAKLAVACHYYYNGKATENLLAHLYDKYWRPSYATPGFMTAIRRQTFVDVGGYDAELIMGEDYDLGYRIAKKFGSQIIHHDRDLVMMISARALRKQGILRRLIKGHKSYSPTISP